MKKHLLVGSICASLALLTFPAFAAEDGEVVKVDLKEWQLGFKDVTVKGEKAVFEITNSGTTDHAFEMEGEIGGKKFEIASMHLKPGEKASFVVALPAGTYEVYCPVEGHKDKGMAGTVKFSGEESSG